jgi:SOS-response transcriptional repressor LexA
VLRLAIKAFRVSGRVPALRELAKAYKSTSKTTSNAIYHLAKLSETGFVEYLANAAEPGKRTARNYRILRYPEGDEFTTPGALTPAQAAQVDALARKFHHGENLDATLVARTLQIPPFEARTLIDALVLRDYMHESGRYVRLVRKSTGERIRRIGASTTIPVTADIEDARVESTEGLVELRVEPDEPTADEVDEYLLWLEGAIAAGEFAEIDTEKELTYLPRVTGPDAAHFLLRVRGLSMLGPPAWIADGDVVVCRRTDTASDGDIVVAVIGEEATLKRFRRVNGGVHLEPLNSAYETIRLTGEDARRLRIQGRAVMIHRPL